jgi:pimeloyl-ACP methyl ester carboxylesterase
MGWCGVIKTESPGNWGIPVSMKTTLLSVFVVALMATASACASSSGGSVETVGGWGSGAVSGSGGRSGGGGTSAWGSTSSGGSSGRSGSDGGTGGGTAPSFGAQNGGAQNGGAQNGGTQNGGAQNGGAQNGGTQNGEAIRTRKIEARGLTFDALEIPSTGEPVLLLHGFPDTSLEWSALMPVLAASGYHCLAPDQRGYSPGARPTDVEAYRYEELVADAFAIASELGDRFHVIGHDWGANVGWLMLEKDPSRIASFTAISIPHYQIWSRSVYEDKAMAGYLSMLNTWMTESTGEAFWTAEQMKSMWTAKPALQREKTIAHMTEPGAMTAALNWYRASRGHKRVIEDFDAWEVSVPTLLIHGSKDLGERSLTDTEPLMKGPYRVVRPAGGHFIVDEQPALVAEEALAHLRANPIE